jgi:hypothetical protein
MKYKLSYFLCLLIIFTACNKESNQKRIAENKKDAKKKELIFGNIKKGWNFYDEPINEATEESVKTWNELRMFLAELAQKPKKTIGAFQLKAAAISKKAMALNDKIPDQFNQPQIKSRISALITKVRMLDLYIHLDDIPDKEVTRLIGEINKELASLQRQMDKIVEKSKIPVEEGESEMIRMLLDSARAIPNNTMIPNSGGMPYNRTNIITDENTPRVE